MKDAKGHGSDKRGAAGADERYAHVMASTKAASDNLQKLIDQHATGGQPVTSNAHAAATLASGSKSAPVDTHPAMSGGPRNAQGYRTTGSAYEGPRTPTPAHGYIHNDPGNTRYRNGQKMPTDL